MDFVARLQSKTSYFCSESNELVPLLTAFTRNLLESIFLLTLDQDFVLHTRADCTVDLHEMYSMLTSTITRDPSFDFSQLTAQDFRDILLNTSRFVAKDMVGLDAYKYCIEHLKVSLR